ncbi:MAG: T9SS type A sorting domain-containing protein [Bacteroidia bacterium]
MKTNICKNMSTTLKAIAFTFLAIPALLGAQTDLTVGLNYAYDPPSGCDNKIKNLTIDVCNNGSAAAGAFEVGIYLYDPSSSQHWVVSSQTMNSLSGNACVTISNWNIDMNTFCCLPSPGNNYRIGVWVDTASAVSETNKNNNTSLLSGNISICAAQGVHNLQNSISWLGISPNPLSDRATLSLSLKQEEAVSVSLYDLTGKLVSSVFDGKLQAGAGSIHLDTHALNSGLYYISVSTSAGTISRKLVIQK